MGTEAAVTGSGGSTTGSGGSTADSGGAATDTDGSATSTGGSAATGSGGSATGSGGSATGTGAATTGAGGAGAGGTGGTSPLTEVDCSFDIEDELSSVIPTVGIVRWSTSLENLAQARIEFTLDDPGADVINTGSGGPISVEGETHRGLLLGLKAESSYTYRIVASSATEQCTSDDRSLTTGSLEEDLAVITRVANRPDEQARGFILAAPGFSAAASPPFVYIIDADGDIVWWGRSSPSCTHALMSWEGTDMWTNQTNVINDGGGLLRRVSMDGLEDETYYDDLTATHHDFTAVPGGIVAALSWQPGSSEAPSEIIERLPDGTVQTVAVLDELAYLEDNYHANAIRYHAADDTYTVSDLTGIFVKVDRAGNVLWQLGGSCAGAPASKCVEGSFGHSHGHHLIDDHLVFFASTNTLYDYQLVDSGSSFTATEVWTFTSDESSIYLGDATRLPNGNTLMTVSSASQIVEVNPEKEVVQTLTTDYEFGYSNFRPTLYGPPTH